MTLVRLLDFSAVAAAGPGTAAVEVSEAAELVDMGRLARIGLGERAWLDAGASVRALGVGVI